jgi:Hydrazine synthase alpha subunit middle domain
MRAVFGVRATALPFILVALFCGFSTSTTNTPDLPVIVTSAPAYDELAALRGGERFPRGAHLLLVPGGKAEPLVAGFAASADASVSFDAKTVLFAGKKSAGDPWQIWELTLADHAVRQVIGGTADVVRPLYLPGRRLVFARRGPHGYQLIAADLDGRNELPLTYMPASAIPDDVLADGRILFEAGFPLATGSAPELYLVYSDGSGVESYRCDHGAHRWGGRQLASGDVVFTHGATLARFTSPLANEVRVGAPGADYAGGIAETVSGLWLVSVRNAHGGDHYALKSWQPSFSPEKASSEKSGPPLTTVLAMQGQNLVEPVLLAPRERPKQHPSALHDWNYANLLALDARQSRGGDLKTTPALVRLETQDASGGAVVLGSSPVESDGSFFVKVPADRPIRFLLVDEKGTVVRQEHGWFWIRRGEQRICVGCHTGPERAAENNVPAVLLRSTTPVDLAGAPSPDTARQAEKGSR